MRVVSHGLDWIGLRNRSWPPNPRKYALRMPQEWTASSVQMPSRSSGRVGVYSRKVCERWAGPWELDAHPNLPKAPPLVLFVII